METKSSFVTTTTTDGRSARQADVWTLRNGKVAVYEGIADTKLYEEIWGTK